jgi:hypothetical protein
VARHRNFLEWPFFDAAHRLLAESLDTWAQAHLSHRPHVEDRASVDAACRELVRVLGQLVILSLAALPQIILPPNPAPSLLSMSARWR